MNAPSVNTLSAVGSAIFPNVVIKLYFRAITPSKKSVILATIKIIPAIIVDCNVCCNK
jgi:hypothetical protein